MKEMSNTSATAKKTVETVSVGCCFPYISLKRGVNEIGPLLVALSLLFLAPKPANAADTLRWGTNSVSADIRSTDLMAVLEKIAGVTGWHVFVEPETLHTVSAKFNNVTTGE